MKDPYVQKNIKIHNDWRIVERIWNRAKEKAVREKENLGDLIFAWVSDYVAEDDRAKNIETLLNLGPD